MRETEKKIANILINDATLGYREIAKKLGISTSNAFNKCKSLFRNGSIIKVVPIFSDVFTGLHYQILVQIQVYGDHIEEVEKEVSSLREVCAVYDVTGDYDIVLIAKFNDRSHMDIFVKRLNAISHIRKTNTSFILNKVKEDFTFKGFEVGRE